MVKKHHHQLFFLNKGRGLAAIEAEVVKRSWKSKKGKKSGWYVEASFSITDCNRQVRLDFDFNKQDRRKLLAKADRLLKAATRFRKALESV